MLAPLRALASDTLRHWGGELRLMPGMVVSADKWQAKWQKGRGNMALDVRLTRASLPADSNDYDRDYNYPTLSVAAKWSLNHGVTMHKGERFWGADAAMKEVDYDSRMGNIISVYGEWARPLLRNKRWEIDYSLALGAGWSRRKYNQTDNIDNELVGSRWLIYVGLGAHATYHFARDWGLRAGLDFYHHSNAALHRPNKGANMLSPSIGIVYQPYYESTVGATYSHVARAPWARYWYLNIAAGIGARTLEEEWQYTQFSTSPSDADYRQSHFKRYAVVTMQADVMCRYARRWATGAGVDLFYCNDVGRAEEINTLMGTDGTGIKPWSVGLAVKHEAFYRQLSVNTSLGFYVYRRTGEMGKRLDKPIYERIGVNYTLPRQWGGLKVGFNVKAHATKADYAELVVAKAFTLTKKKNQKNELKVLYLPKKQ